MAERRSLASFTVRTSFERARHGADRDLQPGDFDRPPATITLNDDSTTGLDRLRRSLERERVEARNQNDAERHERWGNPPLRRRRVRPAGVHSPTYEGRPYQREVDFAESQDERQHSAKRRKLDHNSSPPSKKAFKYGHYGQVEPGRLKLDLHSCDGEVHESGSVHLGPDNVLKHDQSVYCTKAPKCNIILRHHDGSAFCLEKLHIVAPSSGFTAPVKDGKAYISMSLEDLRPFMNHEPSSNYLPPPWSTSRHSQATERLSLVESLNDPYIARAMASGPRQNLATATARAPQFIIDRARQHRARQHVEQVWPTLLPVSRDSTPPQSPTCDPQDTLDDEVGTQIAVLSDEDVGFSEDSTPAAVLLDRRTRERRDLDYAEEEGHGWDPRFRSASSRLERGLRPLPNARAEQLPEDIHEQVLKDENVVQARFHIKNGKNKVAIKFDPPVSGTYILLQMQAPVNRHNIDVQSVIASGYAGPRFFPAVEFV